MKFLLICDTHGKLGVIDDLAARMQADAVILKQYLRIETKRTSLAKGACDHSGSAPP
jgi:hypothetical protein